MSKKGKAKSHWQSPSKKRKRYEWVEPRNAVENEEEAPIQDATERNEFVSSAYAGFEDEEEDNSIPYTPFVASTTGSNQAPPLVQHNSVPDTEPFVADIIQNPAKNRAKNPAKKAKVVQPASIPAKNTQSKVVAPSANTRSKRRL